MTDEIKFDTPEQMNADTFIFVSVLATKKEIFTKKISRWIKSISHKNAVAVY